MNKYETLYILKTEIGEEAIKAMIEKIANIITTNGGTIESTDEWGKKKLAYPIEDLNEGYYVLLNYSAGPELPKELVRNFEIFDDVLRHLVIRKDA